MISVADTVRLFRHCGDFASLFALLPLLAELKFGRLVHAREQLKARGDHASEEQEHPDRSRSLPPPSAHCMLAVSEICANIQLLNPSDKQVTRAYGEWMRAVEKMASTNDHDALLKHMTKLLGHVDVYEVARLMALVGGLLSVAFSTFLLSTEAAASRETLDKKGGILAHWYYHTKALLGALWSPQIWLLLALIAFFVVGNWSWVGSSLQKPAALENVRGAAGLFRAIGMALASTGTNYEGPTPAWAVTSCAASVARLLRLAIFERIGLAALTATFAGEVGKGTVEPKIMVALGMEAWSFAVLLPCILRRPTKILLLSAFLLLCFAMITEGPFSIALEPFVEPVLKQFGLVLGLMSLLLFFLGGLPTVAANLLLIQAMCFVHKIDLSEPSKF